MPLKGDSRRGELSWGLAQSTPFSGAAVSVFKLIFKFYLTHSNKSVPFSPSYPVTQQRRSDESF